ncbi:hypothetical protein F4824DRAFT_468673 [Ustulina deusta]|nr:hypothetical protein F4824DRAFT_468673 [Ustulina deusta]
MPASLASSASRIAARRVLPPIRTHSNLRAGSYSSNISRKTSACITRQYSVGSRSSPVTRGRLLSSSSACLFDKSDATTNAGKDGSPP